MDAQMLPEVLKAAIGRVLLVSSVRVVDPRREEREARAKERADRGLEDFREHLGIHMASISADSASDTARVAPAAFEGDPPSRHTGGSCQGFIGCVHRAPLRSLYETDHTAGSALPIVLTSSRLFPIPR